MNDPMAFIARAALESALQLDRPAPAPDTWTDSDNSTHSRIQCGSLESTMSVNEDGQPSFAIASVDNELAAAESSTDLAKDMLTILADALLLATYVIELDQAGVRS